MVAMSYYPFQSLSHTQDVTECIQMGMHLVYSGVTEKLIMYPPEYVVGKF